MDYSQFAFPKPNYKKNKNNQWEVIYINPEKCIEDKNLNEKTHST